MTYRDELIRDFLYAASEMEELAIRESERDAPGVAPNWLPAVQDVIREVKKAEGMNEKPLDKRKIVL